MARARTLALAWILPALLAGPGTASGADEGKKLSLQQWQPSGQNIYDVSKQGNSGEQGSAGPDNIGIGVPAAPLQDVRAKIKDATSQGNMSTQQGQILQQMIQQVEDQAAAAQLPALGQVRYGTADGYRKVGASRPAPDAHREIQRPQAQPFRAEEPDPLTAPIPRDLSASGPSPASLISADMAAGGPIAPPSEGAGAPKVRWRGSRGFDAARLASPPGDGRRYMDQAWSDLSSGKADKALENADKAVQASESAEAYALRARIYEQLQEHAKKLRDLEKAAALDPEHRRKDLEAAKAGKRLFDPSAEGSLDLLEAQQEDLPPQRPLKPAVLWVLPIAAAALLLSLAVAVWGRLRARLPLLRRDLARRAETLRLWSKRQRAPAVNDPKAPAGARVPEAARSDRRVTHVSGPHTPAQRLRADQVLAGKYRLVRSLGFDGTVEIWKAHDTTLDRPALVKRLYAGVRSSDEGARRLEEARAAGSLHHPNVVDIYEILDLPTGLYVVYEYMPGKSLRHVLREKGSLSLEQVRDVLIPVCKALEHAHHRGVVHGGLSLERILITLQGYVQVSDFVLARTTGTGSEPYAAPETKRGEPKPVSDIYSLGMCFFELLTGELPGQSDREPDPRVAELLEKTLDLDYRTRLSSAREFLAMLKDLSEHAVRPEDGKAPPEVRPDGPAEEPKPNGHKAPDPSAQPAPSHAADGSEPHEGRS